MNFHRRKKIYLSVQQVAALLNLPPGYEVVRLRIDPDPNRIVIEIYSDDFPETDPNCELVAISGTVEGVRTMISRWVPYDGWRTGS